MAKIKEGSQVKVVYTGKLEDGTVFDSTNVNDPLVFTIGKNQVIKGFEDVIAGMKVGDKVNVTIEPEDGYGPKRDELINDIDRSRFPENMELKVGNKLSAKHEGIKSRIEMVIIEVTDDKVTLDANHPLAGKNIVFDIELLEVI